MLDATPCRLKTLGTITIDNDGSIVIEGFEADGATCREVAALAQVWAISALTASLQGDLQQPGGGNCCVG